MAKVLIMAMSLRKDSLNKKFAKNAHKILSENKGSHEIELLSFNDFSMPVYDGDLESQGLPEKVTALANKINSAQAIILSTPEYNGSMPGPFKNTVDWLSRAKPMPWVGKHLLLLGASPGALGAVRSLWHSRIPFEAIGTFVYPEMFGLPNAHLAFDENDQLKDTATAERLKNLLLKFKTHFE